MRSCRSRRYVSLLREAYGHSGGIGPQVIVWFQDVDDPGCVLAARHKEVGYIALHSPMVMGCAVLLGRPSGRNLHVRRDAAGQRASGGEARVCEDTVAVSLRKAAVESRRSIN